MWWTKEAKDNTDWLNKLKQQSTPYLSPSPQPTNNQNIADSILYPKINKPLEKLLNPTPQQMVATAYCGCAQCCGKAGQKTTSGTTPQQGRTVAVPSNIPFGTKLNIQGLGTYIAEDRGGDIKGNRIDIFFNNHNDALNFGKRNVNVTLTA